MKIGFIGLGNMGHAMAANLVKAGHEVTVWNRTPGRAEALRKDGATVADTVAQACRGEAVISMLANDEAVEDVVLGPGNVRDTLARGAVHISTSTITVGLSDRLEQEHHHAGQSYVAAPVLGRPDAAAAAKLNVVAAGDPRAIARCQVLFDAMAQRTYVVGEKPSVANLMKLNVNFLLAAVIECLGETIALIRKSGSDPRQFVDIITGTLFAAPAFKTYGELILEERYEPAGFKLPLGLKDVRSVLLAADALAVPMPVASAVRDSFLTGLAQGWQDLDWSALGRVAAERSGLR